MHQIESQIAKMRTKSHKKKRVNTHDAEELMQLGQDLTALDRDLRKVCEYDIQNI